MGSMFAGLLDDKKARRYISAVLFTAGIVTCFVAALGCATRPIAKLRLYSIYPQEVFGGYATPSNASSYDDDDDVFPVEWKVGLSGVCVVLSTNETHCRYGYAQPITIPSLSSLTGGDFLPSTPHRGNFAKENHMFRVAGAFVLISLFLSLFTSGVHISYESMNTVPGNVLMIIDIGFIIGAQALQINAGHESLLQVGLPAQIHFGQGTSLLWATLVLKIAAIPKITIWVVLGLIAAEFVCECMLECMNCLFQH